MTTKVIFLSILFGCTSPEKEFKIEDNLQPYVDNFFTIAEQHGRRFQKDNLIIKLTHDLVTTKKGLGVTTLRYVGKQLGQRTIEFDYDFWIHATESQHETLSLHEFGHAYLYRVHTDGYSIMNVNISRGGWPQCAGQECDHKFLLDELFKQ